MNRTLSKEEEKYENPNFFKNLEAQLSGYEIKNENLIVEKSLEEKFSEEMKLKELEKEKNIVPKKALTSVNLSWLSSVRKVSTSIANSRIFVKNEGEILFCCSVDGSKHSDYAFDLIAENYLNANVKLLCIHVFNSKLDPNLNYNNKKTTVLEKYQLKIEKFKKQSHFVTEDRLSKIHALEQAMRLAENYQSNFLVCGYTGLKGPKGCNKEQGIGHDYLLSSAKTPVIVVKEETKRETKENKAFKWLFIFDKQYIVFTMKSLMAFLPLINPDTDIVHALGFYNGTLMGTDVLKDQFLNNVEKFGIKNCDYEQISYSDKKPLYSFVNERINFGNDIYDFVCINNSSNKFKADPEKNDTSNIIKGTSINVCFTNN